MIKVIRKLKTILISPSSPPPKFKLAMAVTRQTPRELGRQMPGKGPRHDSQQPPARGKGLGPGNTEYGDVTQGCVCEGVSGSVSGHVFLSVWFGERVRMCEELSACERRVGSECASTM